MIILSEGLGRVYLCSHLVLTSFLPLSCNSRDIFVKPSVVGKTLSWKGRTEIDVRASYSENKQNWADVVLCLELGKVHINWCLVQFYSERGSIDLPYCIFLSRKWGHIFLSRCASFTCFCSVCASHNVWWSDGHGPGPVPWCRSGLDGWLDRWQGTWVCLLWSGRTIIPLIQLPVCNLWMAERRLGGMPNTSSLCSLPFSFISWVRWTVKWEKKWVPHLHWCRKSRWMSFFFNLKPSPASSQRILFFALVCEIDFYFVSFIQKCTCVSNDTFKAFSYPIIAQLQQRGSKCAVVIFHLPY